MTTRLIELLAHVCLTYRKSVLAVLIAISAFALAQMPSLRFNNALDVWFLDDDPALLEHERLVQTFGSDEYIMIGLSVPDVFAPDVLERIDRVTRRVNEAPHVEKVFSLTNIEAVTGDAGMLDVGDLMEFPLDPATLPAIRKRALANELYVGNIVSETGDYAAILARLPHLPGEFDYKVEALTAVRDILADEPDTRFYLTGSVVGDVQFFYISDRSTRFTCIWMSVVLVIALWGLLRSVSGVLLPMLTILLGALWAMGWLALSGSPINVMTTMLPPLLLAVGVASSMHFMVDYQNRCHAGVEKMRALRETYRDLVRPLFLTSLTTAAGMMSLMVSRLEGIRHFGVYAPLGVLGTFVLSVTLVPILLSYLPAPKPKHQETRAWGLSSNALLRLHTYTLHWRKSIVAGWVVLFALAVVGATRVHSESIFLEYFKDDEPFRVDTQFTQSALGGTSSLEVIIETGTPGGIKEPDVLRQIVELQTFLESQPNVTASQSIADYMKDLRRAFFEGRQDEYRLPESREEAAQYLLLYEMDEPDGDILEYVTLDYAQGRISAKITEDSADEAAVLVRRTREYIATRFSKDLDVTVTGIAVLYANMDTYIRQSLVRSFCLALGVIFIVLTVQLRSLVLGAIAMIPNIVPIVLCLGFMGAAGIYLDAMTAMVAAISIGLAVDDTIHLVVRVRQHLDRGCGMREALRRTTVEIGRALVFTSITLCGGFGVMMFARWAGMVNFGMLSAITIFAALAADLLLMPLALYKYGKRMPHPAGTRRVQALRTRMQPRT